MKKFTKKLLTVCIILLATINIGSSNAQAVDIIAPASITNLAVSSVTSYSAVLIWTAPGDDAKIGTASSYDIRYFTGSINASNWPAVIQINNEPAPEIAGTNQTITINNLNPGTTYYFAIKTSDEAANVSAISNIASAKTLGIDSTAPAAITNLTVSTVALNSVILTWTAPGDDAKIGTASSYDIRYFTGSINGTNWPAVIQIDNEPIPKIAGTNQTITIANLNHGTAYYFAIKTSDKVANVSTISNVASAKTTTPEDTTPPEKVKEFAVKNKALKSNNALLTWVNPIDKDFSKVLIIRKENGYSTSINDGVKVYEGAGIQFDDVKIIEGKIYYYSVYSYDKYGEYSQPAQCVFFVNNTLIRKTGDYKIYVVINGEKRWIPTSAVFNRKKYEWKNVYVVSEKDFNDLKTGSAIESDEKIKLIKGKTNPRVYVIKGDKRFWIPTAEAFNKSGYKWKDIVKVEDGEVMGYSDITLAKEENNDAIYYLYTNIGMKKPVPSTSVFLSYPLNKWEDIEILTQAELDSYEDVQLIRKVGNYKVYYLENGVKKFIPSKKVFDSHKFNWAKVSEINETEFNFYADGSDLE